MTTPMVFYVAGPYRAMGVWQQELNIRRAENVAQDLRRVGQFVICPHTNCRFSDCNVSDAQYIAETLELMRRCDVVLVLPGWEDSEGTQGEIAEAERRKMPVFFLNAYGQHHRWQRIVDAARAALAAAA